MAASDTSSELAKLCWADNWDGVRDRLMTFQAELRNADANKILPLHIACWHKAPRDILDNMIKMYPAAVAAQTSGGNFPLDYVKLFHQSPEEDLLALLNPESVIPEEQKSDEPTSTTELHRLCFWKFNEASERLKVFPEEAAFQDENGNLPLHIAIEHQCNVKFLEELLAAHPGGSWHSNKVGKLPLHVAAQNWTKIPVLAVLVKAYPNGVNSTDNYGDLPINFAMKEYPDQAVLKMIEPNEPSTPKWIKIRDPDSGHDYYENQFTKETSWEKPAKGFFE
ncbi:hypothetical protein TeGR_g7359 [Tetraparma gracilis]|uniref:WW domain-containing protein n=1 Tax=Tetraparma gracilis TaxID=2962635 RepID=A0ABQ6MEW9_9STRA|nr:hypothetical protein TeGR_g7359 [Tetraparma gracilis]